MIFPSSHMGMYPTACMYIDTDTYSYSRAIAIIMYSYLLIDRTAYSFLFIMYLAS